MFKYILFFISLPLYAQTITLTTEHYPPYNIDLSLDKSGTGIGGASTEIVLEMMRRSGYSYSMNLMPWKRAYGNAQEKKYTGVFSTTRTEARENLFKWVGPIANNNYVLFANRDKAIEINNDSDLSNYTVGAYRGSVAVSLLQSKGIDAELVRSDHLNVLKLQRGRIDLWISGNLYGPYLAKQYGVDTLTEVYTVRKAQMYIAFNIKTPATIVDNLNNILESMRKEGFLDEVYQRYR
ncbi:MAG: substrate-binding periplasmic protein [Cellvibrionaceae bacterium]